MNPILIKAAPYAFGAAVLIAGHTFAYRAGFQTALDRQQAVIDKMAAQAKEREAESAKAYAESLEKIRAQSAELNRIKSGIEQRALKLAQEVQTNKTQNKQGIENAIAQDKNGADCIDGIGPNGLRQYRNALGYAD